MRSSRAQHHLMVAVSLCELYKLQASDCTCISLSAPVPVLVAVVGNVRGDRSDVVSDVVSDVPLVCDSPDALFSTG
jgi:hypothetical protein